jgi:hypothetical protein
MNKTELLVITKTESKSVVTGMASDFNKNARERDREREIERDRK